MSSENMKRIKSRIVDILKKHNVARAGIFGSYARGTQNKNSDVDILIEVKDKGMSLFDFVGIKLELEDKLGKKIDLVEYKVIKPRIREDILSSEVRII